MYKILLQTRKNHLEKIWNIKEFILNENTTIWEFVENKKLNINQISINLNGLFYTLEEAKETLLKDRDILQIDYLIAGDPVTVTFFGVAIFSASAVTAAIAVFIGNALIAFALNLAIGALTKKNLNKNNTLDSGSKSNQAFGISGGANQAKPYDVYQLGIGKIRIFPNYGQNSFTDFVIDSDTPIFMPTETGFMRYVNIPTLDLQNPRYVYEYDIGGNSSGNYTHFKLYFFGFSRTYNIPNKYENYTAPYRFVVQEQTVYNNPKPPVITRKIYTFENFLIVNGGFQSFPDNSTGNGFVVPDWMRPNFSGTKPQAFSSDPIDYPPPSNKKILQLQYFGFYRFEAQQRLVQLFNLGFGDCNLSSYKIGTINISNFKQVKIDRFGFLNDDSNQKSYVSNFHAGNYIPADTIPYDIRNSVNDILAEHPNYTYNSDGQYIIVPGSAKELTVYLYVVNQNTIIDGEQAQPFIHYQNGIERLGAYPAKPQVLSGGALTRPKDENGADTGENASWVIRNGGLNAYSIEVNLKGRLFRLNAKTGLVEPWYMDIEFFYKEKNGINNYPIPGNEWIFLGNINLKNNTTSTFQKTFFKELPFKFKYIEIAVRKINSDANDSNITDEMAIESINIFNEQLIKYPAQNRIAIEIQASEQLNGSIDRTSVLASYKTWKLTSTGGTDEYLPIVNNQKWVWGETSNPAYWFIHVALGGYRNKKVPASHPLYNKGWFLGQNSNNEAQMFGAGELIENIDFVTIEKWANYCRTNNLNINLEVNASNDNAFNVLSQIASVGRATVHRNTQGKLSVVVHRKDDPIVAVFGMSNIIAGSFSIIFNNKRNADEYVINYADEDNDYQPSYVRAKVPLVQNVINSVNLDFVGITNKIQAQKEANLASAGEFYHKQIVEFSIGFESLIIERGQVIKISHDLTKWGDSGRITKFVLDNNKVSQIHLSIALLNDIGTEYYLTIRTPQNNIKQFLCIIVDTNILKPATNFNEWQANFASQYLDDDNNYNQYSSFNNSIPQDFLFFGSPQQNLNNKYRIVQVQFSGKNQAKLTCINDFAEYYEAENSLDNVGDIPLEKNTSIAYIENMGIVEQNKQLIIFWDNINCSGATLNISANTNGNVTNGLIDVDSDYIVIDYPKGTILNINAMPRNFDVPYAKESKIFNLVV